MSDDRNVPIADTWDDMRSRTFDMYDAHGHPDEDFGTLLSSLGVYGKPRAQQEAAVNSWLESAAARPAPPALLQKARGFVLHHG